MNSRFLRTSLGMTAAIISVGVASAQPSQRPAQTTPPQATPLQATPPATAQSPATEEQYKKNLEATERLSKYMQELQTLIGKNNDLLRRELQDFNEAEKAIDEILAGLKQGIEMGSPDGDFAKLVESFIGAAIEGANRAQARRNDALRDAFNKRKQELEDSRVKLNKMYGEYMNMQREIAGRKDDLALAKQLRSLTQASDIIKGVISKFQDAGPMFRDVFETFPKPFTGPTQ